MTPLNKELVYCTYCSKPCSPEKFVKVKRKCIYCIEASSGKLNKEIVHEETFKTLHTISGRVTPLERSPYKVEPDELTQKRKRILAQRELDRINAEFDL